MTSNQDRSTGNGISCAKVILLGEHAVVYGHTAIAAAIDRRLHVSVKRAAGNGSVGCGEGSVRVEAPFALKISSPEGNEPSPEHTRLRQVVVRAAEIVGVDPHGLRVEIASDVPTAVGLGSSAALSVALVRALVDLSGRFLDPPAVCAAAFELERLFHGLPSGIDNTVATYGGILAYARDATHRQLATPGAIPIVIAIGTAPRQTRTAVLTLRARWEAERRRYDGCFHHIADLVAAAEHAIAVGEWQVLGHLFNRNHALLQQLGVSTPELDAMVVLARAHGAYGAKLTGGGGGGAIVCLRDGDRQPLVEAFHAAGWHAFATDLHNDQRGDHARTQRSHTDVANERARGTSDARR